MKILQDLVPGCNKVELDYVIYPINEAFLSNLSL